MADSVADQIVLPPLLGVGAYHVVSRRGMAGEREVRPLRRTEMEDGAVSHGSSTGLCWENHTCPSCERGQPCLDLFIHPECGLVACSTQEGEPRAAQMPSREEGGK
jgi:hypothetical protein